MSNILNVALLIVAGLGVAYLVILKKRKPKIRKIVVVDPEAQKLYANQKQKPEEEKKLTLEEKIELSWQFLVNIKNQVLKKFSKTDHDRVVQAGTILAENGMKYQHDVEQEVQVSLEPSKSKTKSVPKAREHEQTVAR